MKRIDTIKWKEFMLKELFTVNPTKHHKLTNRNLMQEDGVNPVIVNSSFNNGIGGYTNYDITEKGNVITFSDTTTSDSIFYQPNDFVGYSHVQVVKPILNVEKWNKNSLLFFTVIFKKKASLMNFNYSNKFTRKDALNMIIKLPINDKGELHWEYMENYIKNLENKERNDISKVIDYLDNAKFNKIDTSKWKRFNLYVDNLFEIFSGNKLDKKNMTSIDPSISFIGRSSLDNGVAEKVDKIENIEPYKPGDMTLALGGHYLGSCFIQKEPFYTSQNVNVLRARKDISFNCKLFISTMIFKESQLYYKAFENELNRHVNKGFSILLPVDKNGNPDWEYMENFIEEKYQYIYEMLDSIL